MGLPAIISEKCFGSLSFKKNHDLLVYKNDNHFVEQIIKLKKDRNFSNKISKIGLKSVRANYSWGKSLKKYNYLV